MPELFESYKSKEKEMKQYPIQKSRLHSREFATVPEQVYRRAYEVYCEKYSPQEAMVTGECRGGFGMEELVGFLYARSFPKEEWSMRTDEAWEGMKL